MKPREITFKVSPKELALVKRIVKRAKKLSKHKKHFDVLESEMDIIAVHKYVIKLDLRRLLEADDATFYHDFFGIKRFLNREIIYLENFFLPKCKMSLGDRK